MHLLPFIKADYRRIHQQVLPGLGINRFLLSTPKHELQFEYRKKHPGRGPIVIDVSVGPSDEERYSSSESGEFPVSDDPESHDSEV